MTLNQLLYEIDEAYEILCLDLANFLHIREVSKFVDKRGRDLEDFKSVVGEYKEKDNVIYVAKSLASRGYSSKYQAICMLGKDYFVVTKKIQHIVAQERKTEATFPEFKEEDKPNFDEDYAIFDDLDEKERNKLFHNQDE